MTSEQLFYDKKTGFDRLTDEDKQGIQIYAEGYKKFLDESKTERDAVLEIARMAESKGFPVPGTRDEHASVRATRSTASTATRASCWLLLAKRASPRACA